MLGSQVSVTVLRDVPGPVDPYGAATVASTTSTTYDGCVVYQTVTTEVPVVGRDQTISDLTVLMPYGADVAATDRLSIAGETFAVVGEPVAYEGLTGWTPGSVVYAQRAAG